MLNTVDAISTLFQQAAAAWQRHDRDGAARLAARLYREMDPEWLETILSGLLDGWLRATIQVSGPSGMAQASLAIRAGVEAAVAGTFAPAADAFETAANALTRATNPTAVILVAAARLAAQQTLEEAAREPRIVALVEEASRRMVTAGRRREAIPLLSAALEELVLSGSPRDRERVRRIREALADLEALPAAEVLRPAPEPPPPVTPDAKGWADLGKDLLREHPAMARLCFERALEQDPQDGSLWTLLSRALFLEASQGDAAAQAFDDRAAALPGDLSSAIGLAASLQEAGRFQEAIPVWDRVIALAPGTDGPVAQRAFCAEAQVLLERGGSLGSLDWTRLGIAFAQEQRWQRSDFAHDQALRLDPANIRSLCGKGLANHQWGMLLKVEGRPVARLRFQIARDTLKEALALLPDNETLLEVIALCERELGAPDA